MVSGQRSAVSGPEGRKTVAGGEASVTSATTGSSAKADAPRQGREKLVSKKDAHEFSDLSSTHASLQHRRSPIQRNTWRCSNAEWLSTTRCVWNPSPTGCTTVLAPLPGRMRGNGEIRWLRSLHSLHRPATSFRPSGPPESRALQSKQKRHRICAQATSARTASVTAEPET